MSTTLPLFLTQYIVKIVVSSAVILSTLLAFCVCRQQPRFHVYILLLANLFGVISYALSFHELASIEVYNTETSNTASAVLILMNLSSNLTFLVGFFALQQLTKTYLGGAQPWIKVASFLASLWTIVVLVISGVTFSNNISDTIDILVVVSIFGWGIVALCALLLLVLIGIRIFYNNRVPSGKPRRQVLLAFTLLGFYVLLLTADVVVSNVLPYVTDVDSFLVSSLIVDIILFRAPGFLFAVFYRRLSAMPPYVEQTDVENSDVEPLKA